MAQCLTFELLRRGAGMPLSECLRMENRLVYNLVVDTSSDFYAGVEAVLVHKTGAPKWRHASVGAVAATEVAVMFEPISPLEELQLPDRATPKM